MNAWYVLHEHWRGHSELTAEYLEDPEKRELAVNGLSAQSDKVFWESFQLVLLYVVYFLSHQKHKELDDFVESISSAPIRTEGLEKLVPAMLTTISQFASTFGKSSQLEQTLLKLNTMKKSTKNEPRNSENHS